MSVCRVLLLDCNLEPTSGEIFEAAIVQWAPPEVVCHCIRIPDTDGAFWADEAGDYDGLIISGSAAGIQSGPPWVAPLAASLRRVTARGLPTLGICFGHQVLAYAWGGTIEEDRLGYKIRDVCDVFVQAPTDARTSGDLLFAGMWQTPSLQVLSSHRDQVVTAPDGWEVLARTEACPIQAMAAVALPIVTVQWHPEANPAFIIENPHPDWDHLASRDLVGLSGNHVLRVFFEGVVANASA